MQGIKIDINDVGARLDIALVVVSGYVDTTTCQELGEKIHDLIDQKKYQIIMNLAGVTYISSAGWGVFMGEIKNIRDQGGDIKVVQMPPEVYEVFEMLEFNRILNYYDSVEEAIDEFDIIRGIDITQVDEEVRRLAQNASPEIIPVKPPVMKKKQHGIANGFASQKSFPAQDFPLAEKIKMIVIDNPLRGILGIKKELNSEKYGHIRINLWTLHTHLKNLNLESKEKRYRFYRSR